jgi:hypothetical protein
MSCAGVSGMVHSAHAQAFGPDDEVLIIDDEDVLDIDDEEAPVSLLDYEKLHDDAC